MQTALPSFFLAFPLSFFFLIKVGFFSRCEGHDHWFHCSSVPNIHKYTSLQSSRVARDYGRIRRTAKTQAVCVELGPLCRLCSILGFPLPTQPSPLPPPLLAGVIRALIRRGSGVLDIFYLQTAFFFRLEMRHKPILCPNVAQKCKTCPRLPQPPKFCFKHQRCSKVTQVY